MLCPGISQNTKLHHLTLYKGQVWKEKSYSSLCNHNVILYNYIYIGADENFIDNDGDLIVPPMPGFGFTQDISRIPWDSEILQSFAELTDSTDIIFRSPYDSYVRPQIQVGSYLCMKYNSEHFVQCVSATRYEPRYIWTKEGFKIEIR